MKYLYYILLSLVVMAKLTATPVSIPVTRNLLESEHPVHCYADYLADLNQQPVAFQEVFRSQQRLRTSWLCVIETNLSAQLENELLWWTADLAQDEKSVIIVNWTGDSCTDLKNLITSYYYNDAISGVFLLGNLPVFWFEMWEDWEFDNQYNGSEAWVEFPMDAYFADLDGIWSDFNQNGISDYHSGNMALEIAVGRLRADNLPLAGDEVALLQNWFIRNNLFRNGILADSDLALGYIDDDWADWQQEYFAALNLAYQNVEMVFLPNSTTANDFRSNRWHTDYEWIQLHAHSGPDAHYIYQNNGTNYNLVYNHEIIPQNPQALFYNLFCCSNSRFTEENAMGSLYILGNEHGLATIGSTKTGSMLMFENFYAHLPAGESLGDALRLWWNSSVDVDPQYLQGYRSWFYGMTLLGDPLLNTEYEAASTLGDVDYNGYIEAFDASLILRQCLGLLPQSFSPARSFFADTDGNQSIDAYDASLILQLFVGLINNFPAE